MLFVYFLNIYTFLSKLSVRKTTLTAMLFDDASVNKGGSGASAGAHAKKLRRGGVSLQIHPLEEARVKKSDGVIIFTPLPSVLFLGVDVLKNSYLS